MNISKILVAGSTIITQNVVNYLQQYDYDLVGYVPSKNPTFPGKINLPEMSFYDVDQYDLILSIQYDRKVRTDKLGFNLHTGLLPEYGGLDILTHTIMDGARFQGLTFHKMTDKYDYGPIISWITYPVFGHDTVESLYKRMMWMAGPFAHSCFDILQSMNVEDIDNCVSQEPTLLKRTGEPAPNITF